jgi:hypothetical protein
MLPFVNLPIRRFVACLLAMFAQGAASCSPSSAPSAGPEDGGSDDSHGRDASFRDAPTGDATFDGGPIGCPVTIDAYCAPDGGFAKPGASVDGPCVRDWSTAMQNASLLCTGAPFSDSRNVWVYPQCDAYDLVVVGYTDTSTFYYYDPGMLDLVRIEDHGNGGAFCVAGQPGPVVPLTDCFDALTPKSICVADGGPG